MQRVIDERDVALAKLLVRYSTKVRRGEIAMVSAVGSDCIGLAQACIEEILAVGAVPYFQFVDPIVQRTLIAHGTETIFRSVGSVELALMKRMQVFIGIRASDNIFELNGLPNEKLNAYTKHVTVPVHMKQRVKHTRWVVLRYPNSAMAQLAQMSSEEFADFYYKACLVDYDQMRRGATALKRLMEQASEVRITGPGTDLRLSIKNMPVIACCGEMNIPDGECFTAPRKFSVEGHVSFNAPTVWEGRSFDNISLTFRRGKVVAAQAATAEQTRRLEEILSRDEGARYVGEFALGFHPTIRRPMRDILFDEKICGSFHMALGQCYDEAPNGNKSQIHWDLVCIQLPQYGGGEIYFDGKLVRKDGQFIIRELIALNSGKSLSARGKK
ncbi:MAG: aminopeptidase [Candidatus Sumerlaeaceae bacterium]|nr:aminopeptidase [Candidatus Sumerlaeaceae bacterium]